MLKQCCRKQVVWVRRDTSMVAIVLGSALSMALDEPVQCVEQPRQNEPPSVFSQARLREREWAISTGASLNLIKRQELSENILILGITLNSGFSLKFQNASFRKVNYSSAEMSCSSRSLAQISPLWYKYRNTQTGFFWFSPSQSAICPETKCHTYGSAYCNLLKKKAWMRHDDLTLEFELKTIFINCISKIGGKWNIHMLTNWYLTKELKILSTTLGGWG